MTRYYKGMTDPLSYVRDTRTVLVDAISTGQTLPVFVRFIPDTWTTVAEAPRFSVIDNAERFFPPDDQTALLASDRTLRPGELFFQTPLIVHNRSSGSVRIEIRVRYPDSTTPTDNFSRLFDVILPAPGSEGAGETVLLPIQGMHLVRLPDWEYGQRLQARCTPANGADMSFTCTEQEMPRHFVSREILEDDTIPQSGSGD